MGPDKNLLCLVTLRGVVHTSLTTPWWRIAALHRAFFNCATRATMTNHLGCWYDVTPLLCNCIFEISQEGDGSLGRFPHKMKHCCFTYHFHPKLYPDLSQKYLLNQPEGYGVSERHPTPLSPLCFLAKRTRIFWFLIWFLRFFTKGPGPPKTVPITFDFILRP